MSIEELDDLIDLYRHAQMCGTHASRSNARDALKSAFRDIEAERDAHKAQAKLYEHMVITCGVAATHYDANLTRTGAYAEKWNSAQAEQVRALRAERDALRKDAERYRHMRASFARDIKHRLTWYLPSLTPMTVEGLDSAIDAAIAAKEPR